MVITMVRNLVSLEGYEVKNKIANPLVPLCRGECCSKFLFIPEFFNAR